MCKYYSVCGSFENCYFCQHGENKQDINADIYDFGLSLVSELWTDRKYLEALAVLEDMEEKLEETLGFLGEDWDWIKSEIEAWRDIIETER